MYTAAEVDARIARMKAEGASKAKIIDTASDMCIGWPYVFGAYGQDCTTAQRKKYAGYRQDHAAAIRDACPVLGQKQSAISAHIKPGCPVSCESCDWHGTLIDDCRGFTRRLLQWVGLSLYGGTVTAQWEYGPNWVVKGNIQDMPRDLVCCVFRPSHTGMYVGESLPLAGSLIRPFGAPSPEGEGSGVTRSVTDEVVRHCGGRKGQVVEEQLPGSPKWERYGIPAGLYTNAELEAAGVNFDPAKNIPTLRRGSSGDEVAELQALLNAKYGADLDIDGVFGAKTETAVKAFQKAHGLTVDGVVGPKTRAAIRLTLAAETNAGADMIRPNPDAIADPAGEAAPLLPTSMDDVITLPLSDWQTIRAAVLAAYHIILNHEGESV